MNAMNGQPEGRQRDNAIASPVNRNKAKLTENAKANVGTNQRLCKTQSSTNHKKLYVDLGRISPSYCFFSIFIYKYMYVVLFFLTQTHKSYIDLCS